MCTPTAQDYFSDERYDDSEIAHGDRLLRHCCTSLHFVSCPINGRKLSDQVFKRKTSDAGTSVDLECLLAHDELTWESRFGTMPNTLAMVAVTAGDVRAVAGGVAWTPRPEQPDLAPLAVAEPNIYHGEIVGQISRANERSLARKAVILKQLF